MRLIANLTAAFIAGSLSSAIAADQQSPPISQQAQSSSPAPAAATPVKASTPTATTPAAPEPARKELSKDLIKQAKGLGYKIEHRGDEVYFCRNEVKMGSRFEQKVCATPDQLDLIARESREIANKIQHSNMGKIPGGN